MWQVKFGWAGGSTNVRFTQSREVSHEYQQMEGVTIDIVPFLGASLCTQYHKLQNLGIVCGIGLPKLKANKTKE